MMSKRWGVSALVGLGLLSVAGVASAAPETHDGFYFRGALGLGYLKTKVTVDGAQSYGDISYSGLAVGLDAWFGGSLMPGLVLGGGITSFDVPNPTVKIGDTSATADGRLMLNIVGMFADYYFDPNKGMHAEALLGYGILSAQSNNGQSSGNDPTGLALGVGFGNDWWVSDEWSIGVLGRFIYAPLSYSVGGATAKYSTITPALLATFTFN